MKKLIAVIVIVLVLAVLGLPPVLGMRTESTITVRMGDPERAYVLQTTVDEYDRGWFSSEATVRVGFADAYLSQIEAVYGAQAGVDALPVLDMLRAAQLLVRLDIAHGPVSVQDGVFVGLSKFVARPAEVSAPVQQFLSDAGMPYLFELRGRMGPTGAFDFDGDIPPFDYANPLGQVEFSGATVDGSLTGNDLDATFAIESLFAGALDNTVDVANLTAVADIELLTANLYTGTVEAGIDSILVGQATGGTPMFAMDDLSFTSGSEIDAAGLYDTRGDFMIARVSVREDVEVTNANLGFRLENVSVDVMERYATLWQNLDFENPQAITDQVQPLLEDLFATDPVLAYDPISFEYFGESFTASVEIRGNSASAAAIQSFDLNDPSFLARIVEVTANLDVSKALVERVARQVVTGQLETQLAGQELPEGQSIEAMAEAQTNMMLAQVVGPGFVIDAGDRYTASIEFADGTLTVNGSPMPVGL